MTRAEMEIEAKLSQNRARREAVHARAMRETAVWAFHADRCARFAAEARAWLALIEKEGG